MPPGVQVRFGDLGEHPYGVFCPHSPHAVRVRRVKYPSVHHYVLATKYKGTEFEQQIRNAKTTWEIDRVVRRAEQQRAERGEAPRDGRDWNAQREDAMLLGCYHKFTQHPELLNLLLSTGAKDIVHFNPTDNFWGDGGDGSGKNALGHILQAVRKKVQGDPSTVDERAGVSWLPSGSNAGQTNANNNDEAWTGQTAGGTGGGGRGGQIQATTQMAQRNPNANQNNNQLINNQTQQNNVPTPPQGSSTVGATGRKKFVSKKKKAEMG